MPIRHTIEQGDTVARLAERYGLRPESIWDHAENSELKALRENMNILAPGDVLTIPDREPRQFMCSTNQRHVFRRIGVPMLFKIRLLKGGKPRKSVLYRLEVEQLVLEGVTDVHGCIARYIPNSAQKGRLRADGGRVDVELLFGHMDPAAAESGVCKRLTNLGYGPVTDGEALRAALMAFQRDAGLPDTGNQDAQTQRRLADAHDASGGAAAPQAPERR